VSRRGALGLLWLLGTILVLGLIDGLITPRFTLVPEWAISTAIAILSGVAIGAILSGLRANGNRVDNGVEVDYDHDQQD
jgi:hypothetical protein